MSASNTYGRQNVQPLTNKSGGGVIAGDVVIIDTSNDESFTTTTSAAFTGLVGVAQDTIANNAVGRVLIGGYAALINTSGSVTRGHYGATHTVAKQAADVGASRTSGTFVQFEKSGTTPSGTVFNPDLGTGGSTIITKDEGSTLSSSVTTLDFVGAGVVASGAGATTTVTVAGGISHSYVGYNTIGGSSAGMVANTMYLKPFTPGVSGLITSVGWYTKQNANGATPNVSAGIWDDVTGSPIHILATSGTESLSLETGGGAHTHDARWLTMAVVYYVTGGTTYWMGVQCSTASFDIYKDGSGGDGTAVASGTFLGDTGATFTTFTGGTDKFSIRADFLS